MCSESGKQVYITSIHVGEKNQGKMKKKRQEKIREFRFSQGSSKFGEKAGKYHFIYSYTFNGTDVTVYKYSQETCRMLLSVFHLVTAKQYYFL